MSHLSRLALVFGGRTLTASDIAVRAHMAGIDNSSAVASLEARLVGTARLRTSAGSYRVDCVPMIAPTFNKSEPPGKRARSPL